MSESNINSLIDGLLRYNTVKEFDDVTIKVSFALTAYDANYNRQNPQSIVKTSINMGKNISWRAKCRIKFIDKDPSVDDLIVTEDSNGEHYDRQKAKGIAFARAVAAVVVIYDSESCICHTNAQNYKDVLYRWAIENHPRMLRASWIDNWRGLDYVERKQLREDIRKLGARCVCQIREDIAEKNRKKHDDTLEQIASGVSAFSLLWDKLRGKKRLPGHTPHGLRVEKNKTIVFDWDNTIYNLMPDWVRAFWCYEPFECYTYCLQYKQDLFGLLRRRFPKGNPVRIGEQFLREKFGGLQEAIDAVNETRHYDLAKTLYLKDVTIASFVGTNYGIDNWNMSLEKMFYDAYHQRYGYNPVYKKSAWIESGHYEDRYMIYPDFIKPGSALVLTHVKDKHSWMASNKRAVIESAFRGWSEQILSKNIHFVPTTIHKAQYCLEHGIRPDTVFEDNPVEIQEYRKLFPKCDIFVPVWRYNKEVWWNELANPGELQYDDRVFELPHPFVLLEGEK
jgi:hypothetical protein